MTRSELAAKLREENASLTTADCKRIVAAFVDAIVNHLASGGRVELRGFGAFSSRTYAAGAGRNPATGAAIQLAERRRPFFKPGKSMHERLNLERANATA